MPVLSHPQVLNGLNYLQALEPATLIPLQLLTQTHARCVMVSRSFENKSCLLRSIWGTSCHGDFIGNVHFFVAQSISTLRFLVVSVEILLGGTPFS